MKDLTDLSKCTRHSSAGRRQVEAAAYVLVSEGLATVIMHPRAVPPSITRPAGGDPYRLMSRLGLAAVSAEHRTSAA